MDVPIPQHEQKRRRRRTIVAAGAGVLALTIAIYAASRIGSAALAVDRAGLWIDVVKQGDMSREVHGVGELVPDDDASRWVAAELDGRVEKRLLETGANVGPDSVLLELSNPDVEQAAVAAKLALDAAQAAYESLNASLTVELLSLRASAAAIEAERAQAAIQADADARLASQGLVPSITAQTSKVRADSLIARVTIEQSRIETTEKALTTRLSAQRSEVESRRTLAELKQRDVRSMTVRAGMTGVLQELVVEVGQRLARGANLARIVDPSRLKAQIRIPEAQTDDLRTGLPVTIDTHNGIVPGRVSRIAPAAQNGTVTIDVRLEGAVPRGARPDMTVDGAIELEHLTQVRQVGRPASGSADGRQMLFRLTADGTHAERIAVQLGRASSNVVEIVDGDLKPGDRVVLSDTSSWNDHSVVQLR